MIKQSLKDQILHINIANLDFSYRIPTAKLGDIINWRIGENKSKGIVIDSVSKWAIQLFTNKVTELKYIRQFQNIVLQHSPICAVNWENTFLAVSIQNDYNWQKSSSNTAKIKVSEDEIIANLKQKYKLV
tara:strand:+ start:103 stop:492 length:390 start_codon:yes stop_codon:yes gene_type:complete